MCVYLILNDMTYTKDTQILTLNRVGKHVFSMLGIIKLLARIWNLSHVKYIYDYDYRSYILLNFVQV